MQGFETLSNAYLPMRDMNTTIAEEARHSQHILPRITAGAKFDSVAINVPRHLLHLLRQAQDMGAVIIQQRLEIRPDQANADRERSLTSVLQAAEAVIKDREARNEVQSSRVDVFVNAMGLTAGRICADENMYPIKGQTVLVKGEAKAIRTRQGKRANGEKYIAYCIPRPGSGTTILGGSKEEGNRNGDVDGSITKCILSDCRILAPELMTGKNREFEVVSAQVGLRPARRGGARLEGEIVGGRPVVHAYGHSGAGSVHSLLVLAVIVSCN